MTEDFKDVLPRILVAGIGPIPHEAPEKLFAPGLRVWGIARQLAGQGHSVMLVCGEFGDTGKGATTKGYLLEPSQAMTQGQITRIHPKPVKLNRQNNDWGQLIASEACGFKADAAVGTTDVMNHALARAKLNIPIWMDYFGDPMAEQQMLAYRHKSDDGLIERWGLVAPALARADRVSGCSSEQIGALFGQMSVVGRLGRFTAEEILVEKIPPWIENIMPPQGNAAPTRKKIVRGKDCPQDAIVVIQTGGFNTWLDVENLFHTLEFAMTSNPKLHFVSTGGGIPGHYEKCYELFTELLQKSGHPDRYHLLGWIPMQDVPNLISEADIGLNVDLNIVEGRLGTRNRLLDWLAGGLAVISTPGCELAQVVGREGHLAIVPHNKPHEIAKVILEMAADPNRLKATGDRASKYVREQYSATKCLEPLTKWARQPKSASDLRSWREGRGSPPQLFNMANASSPTSGRGKQSVERRLAWLENRKCQLEGSRLVKFAMKLRRTNDLEDEPEPPKP